MLNMRDRHVDYRVDKDQWIEDFVNTQSEHRVEHNYGWVGRGGGFKDPDDLIAGIRNLLGL